MKDKWNKYVEEKRFAVEDFADDQEERLILWAADRIDMLETAIHELAKAVGYR